MANTLELLNLANLAYLMNNGPTLVNYTAVTANSGTTTGELAVINTPTITFKSNRAYRITYKGAITSSAAGSQVTGFVRNGTVTGNTYINGFRNYTPAASNIPFLFANIVTNTSGADISEVLVGTVSLLVAGTGGATCNLAASGPNPTYLLVEDIGSASLYSNATSVQ